jgi:hypothetical protein
MVATWEDDEDYSRVLDFGRLRLAGCSGAARGQISGGGGGGGSVSNWRGCAKDNDMIHWHKANRKFEI